MHSQHFFILLIAILLISCEQKKTTNVIVSDTTLDEKPFLNAKHLISKEQFIDWQKDSQDLIIIDVRRSSSFEKGHIVKASQIWRPSFRSDSFPYSGMMLEKEALATLMGKFGASPSSKIILYDDKGNVDAVRLWWILAVYGHSNAYILNGGIHNISKEWITQNTSPNKQQQIFSFLDQERPELKADKEDVLAAITDDNVILLDCRTTDEFTGKVMKKGAFRAGHIPSAIHIDYSEAIAYEKDHTFRNLSDLETRFKEIPKDKKIIVYCQSGVRSAHTTFVLRELLGYSDVANYDGSWIEWSYDKSLPCSVDPKIDAL